MPRTLCEHLPNPPLTHRKIYGDATDHLLWIKEIDTDPLSSSLTRNLGKISIWSLQPLTNRKVSWFHLNDSKRNISHKCKQKHSIFANSFHVISFKIISHSQSTEFLMNFCLKYIKRITYGFNNFNLPVLMGEAKLETIPRF